MCSSAASARTRSLTLRVRFSFFSVDSSAARSPAEDEGAFYSMMAVLSKNRNVSAVSATGHNQKIPPFVLAVKDGHGIEHCGRAECPMRLSSGLSLPHACSLPASYVMLCDRQVALLRKTYCRLHCTHGKLGRVPSFGSHPRQLLHIPKLLQTGPLCSTCLVPHHDVVGDGFSPSPAINAAAAAAQQRAAEVLASVTKMASATAATSPEEDCGCPEREWEEGLLILAQAMAMHCRTRSANEIIAFMHDEIDSSDKRPANSFRRGLVDGADSSGSSPMRTRSPMGTPTLLPSLPEAMSTDEALAAFDHSHSHPSEGCGYVHCLHDPAAGICDHPSCLEAFTLMGDSGDVGGDQQEPAGGIGEEIKFRDEDELCGLAIVHEHSHGQAYESAVSLG